jgi:hypothetical protein
MDPIFDRNGRTLGWLNGEVIYDLRGRARAFVRSGSAVN